MNNDREWWCCNDRCLPRLIHSGDCELGGVGLHGAQRKERAMQRWRVLLYYAVATYGLMYVLGVCGNPNPDPNPNPNPNPNLCVCFQNTYHF